MTATDAARDIFAVSDVLAGEPMLRRALSDPSAGTEQRIALADRLFGGRIADDAKRVLGDVVARSWPSPEHLVRGLEREGVVTAFSAAQADGSLDRVTAELNVVGKAVSGSAELSTLLRSGAIELEAKQGLIARLLGTDVHPLTVLLSERAVEGHKRTFGRTVDDYLEIAATMAQVVVAKVTVARPLDEARLERLRTALSARVGTPVTLQVDIDPAVVGGVSVTVGHEVYESTVAGRLEEVRRQLINS